VVSIKVSVRFTQLNSVSEYLTKWRNITVNVRLKLINSIKYQASHKSPMVKKQMLKCCTSL